MIPEATLDRIREATDIVQLISEYVPLKKRGQNYIGLCPFHSEKTPSFNVNPARQIYHCFGCGRGGNVFKFLVEHERMGFVEAVRMLAERAHIEIPRDQRRSDDANDRIYAANLIALEYFRKALRHEDVGRAAREYLAKRGIKQVQIDDFLIGYAPRRRQGLIRYADRHHVPARDLEAAGLVYSDRQDSTDRFVDRLIFPIRNLSGKPIAFGGRDLTGQARAKYLNSPETPVYQKGRVLYGLYESKRNIQDQREVLVCEGYTDLIRLHEFGFANVVAASGTAFTPDQARLLSRYAERALLIFDADGPGMAAALRSVAILYDAGMDVRIAAMSSGEDPDSFLTKFGADALRERLEGARGYVEYLEERAGGPFTSLSHDRQDHLIADIADTVRRIADPVRRELVTQAAWSRFGIAEDVFRQKLATGPVRRSADDTEPVSAPSPASGWRTELLQLLLVYPEVRGEAAKVILPDEFADPVQRDFLRLVLEPRHVDSTPDQLMTAAGDRRLARLISALASRDTSAVGGEFGRYVRKLRMVRLESQSDQLLQQITAAEKQGDVSAVESLSTKYNRVRREWVQLDRESRIADS